MPLSFKSGPNFIQNSSSNHKEILHMTRQQCCCVICKSFYRFEGHLSELNYEQNLPYGSPNWGCLLINSADMVLIAAQMGPHGQKQMFRIFTQHTLMSAQLLCQIGQQRHWWTGKGMLGMLTPSSDYRYMYSTWFHKEHVIGPGLVRLIPGSLITCMLFKLKSRPYLSYAIRTIHCDAHFPTQNHKKINNHAPRILACQDLMKIGLGHHHVYHCGFISQPYILNNKICHFTSWESHRFRWDRLHSAY